jgi:ATP-dependent DNA helicase RecQ
VPVSAGEPSEELFEKLRVLRKQLAEKENVPAYRIFPDTVLTAFATTRPTTEAAFRATTGVGEVKFQAYGDTFLTAIREYDKDHPARRALTGKPLSATVTPRKQLAFDLYRDRAAVEDVMHQTGVARSTASDYLAEFVDRYRPADVSVWLPNEVLARVKDAVKEVGDERLKPIFEKLNGEVPYDQIRIAVAFLRVDSSGK